MGYFRGHQICLLLLDLVLLGSIFEVEECDLESGKAEERENFEQLSLAAWVKN